MPVIAPDRYASIPSYELLEAAELGHVAVDQRLLHALLDDPARTLPGIVKFANETRDGRVYLGEDLMRIFCVHPSVDAMPFLEREIRAFPDDIPEEITEILTRLGPQAVEPLLALQRDLGDQGSELLFELACLGVEDSRIEEYIRSNEAERDFLLPMYHEHSQRKLEIEPYEIWARYPEEDEPDFTQAPDNERLPFLDSEYAPHRIEALDAWLHEEHSPALRAKILRMAKSDPEIDVRCIAWEALREDFDAPDIRRALLARLKDGEAPLEDRVSVAIASSYMHYEEPEVGKVLREAYEDEDLRAGALQGMWRTLDQEFAGFAEPHLGEEERPDVRTQALVAAGMLRMSDSIPEIEQAFDSADFRHEALYAWILASPGATSKAEMAALRTRLEAIAEGFDEDDAAAVERAIELRCDLAGVDIAEPVKQAVSAKVGRNDPCPCGSGKKYKKCCGA